MYDKCLYLIVITCYCTECNKYNVLYITMFCSYIQENLNLYQTPWKAHKSGPPVKEGIIASSRAEEENYM